MTTFQVLRNFFKKQDHPRRSGTTSTFIEFIRIIKERRLFHAVTREVRARIYNPFALYARTTSHDYFCAITRKVSLTLLSRCTHEERRNTVSALSHAKLLNSTLLSRCTHEQRHKTIFVCYHTQNQFQSRFHAISREVSYGKSPDSRSTVMADSVGNNRPRSITTTRKPDTRCGMQRSRWRIGGLGRWQSSSLNDNDEKAYMNYNTQPGRELFVLSPWDGEIISSRYKHGVSTSNIFTRAWVSRHPASSPSSTGTAATTTASSRSTPTMAMSASSSSLTRAH